jgi:predicted AAA+ superfamily ATPase
MGLLLSSVMEVEFLKVVGEVILVDDVDVQVQFSKHSDFLVAVELDDLQVRKTEEFLREVLAEGVSQLRILDRERSQKVWHLLWLVLVLRCELNLGVDNQHPQLFCDSVPVVVNEQFWVCLD